MPFGPQVGTVAEKGKNYRFAVSKGIPDGGFPFRSLPGQPGRRFLSGLVKPGHPAVFG